MFVASLVIAALDTLVPVYLGFFSNDIPLVLDLLLPFSLLAGSLSVFGFFVFFVLLVKLAKSLDH